MSSKTYKIINWEGIISTGSTPLTSLTIIPDLELIQVLERNKNNMLQIQISGTNSGYDNVWFGLFDKAANVPSCRKNFYDLTGFWIVTINCPWIGAPNNYGQFSILNGPFDNYNKKKHPKPQPTMSPSTLSPSTMSPSTLRPSNSFPSNSYDSTPLKMNFELKNIHVNNKTLIYISGVLILLSIILLTFHMLNKHE
jgi:hypothetical protein